MQHNILINAKAVSSNKQKNIWRNKRVVDIPRLIAA